MSTDSEYEEYGGGPDALMAAITGEPLSREARRDPRSWPSTGRRGRTSRRCGRDWNGRRRSWTP